MKNPKQHSGPKKSAGLKRLNASLPPDLLESKTPDWHQALKALRHGQTKPLGELLSAGGAVPIEVLMILGMMLAPSPHYRGTRLMAVVPTRWTDEAILKRFVERVETSQEIMAALQKYNGQKEAAIVAVAADRRKSGKKASRAFLFECSSKASFGPLEWEAFRLRMLEALSTVKGNRA